VNSQDDKLKAKGGAITADVIHVGIGIGGQDMGETVMNEDGPIGPFPMLLRIRGNEHADRYAYASKYRANAWAILGPFLGPWMLLEIGEEDTEAHEHAECSCRGFIRLSREGEGGVKMRSKDLRSLHK
jgi:hypothetical protein